MKTRPQISAYIAMSIDGFIARGNGDLDWLDSFNIPDEDYGYQAFYQTIDALILGRNSYEKVLNFGAWPYADKRVIVLSNTLQTVQHKAEVFSGETTDLISQLHKDGIKHIYIDGGITINHFLNAKLVDRIILSIIPIWRLVIILIKNLKNNNNCGRSYYLLNHQYH